MLGPRPGAPSRPDPSRRSTCSRRGKGCVSPFVCGVAKWGVHAVRAAETIVGCDRRCDAVPNEVRLLSSILCCRAVEQTADHFAHLLVDGGGVRAIANERGAEHAQGLAPMLKRRGMADMHLLDQDQACRDDRQLWLLAMDCRVMRSCSGKLPVNPSGFPGNWKFLVFQFPRGSARGA